MSLTVTVLDSQSGETETATVADGDYILICVAPCYLDHTQASANGTHVLTVKGRTAR